MPKCDVLIGVDNANKDLISEVLYDCSYTVEVCEGQTFFFLEDIETDLDVDSSLISLDGALDEIGYKNYCISTANINLNCLIIEGNPQKFGVQAVLKYGNAKPDKLH
jgi:hypothetical protein